MSHQKSSDYKETAVQYYLIEDKHKKKFNAFYLAFFQDYGYNERVYTVACML